ncbi:hypothetical protein [Bradyrhizobium sp. 200]|uniref:hypothetical protein n=1 Tax=Bradyrhizobium sp. 200 TaxID=2782665 RepID=UPI001FFE9A4A|nr:hypothetical protein [Bradyrhizobium sp. 200]
MPLLRDYQPERVDDEMVDMMGYDVVGEGDGARFLITHQGARLAATYGNERVDPAERPRYLDDAVGPERYVNVVDLYRACLRYRRPAYSISTVLDADGKEVSYERLLMPFGSGDAVQQIVGSFKSISIEGGFKISNLMGLRPKAEPAILVRAIIDRAFVPAQAGPHSTDEVIDLD